MSSREYSTWLAYDRMEPIGELREDYRLGSLMSLLYTIHKKAEAPGKSALDFMPFFPQHMKPTIEMTGDEIKTSLFQAFGGFH